MIQKNNRNATILRFIHQNIARMWITMNVTINKNHFTKQCTQFTTNLQQKHIYLLNSHLVINRKIIKIICLHLSEKNKRKTLSVSHSTVIWKFKNMEELKVCEILIMKSHTHVHSSLLRISKNQSDEEQLQL